MANFFNSFIQNQDTQYAANSENPLFYRLNYLQLIGDVTGNLANGLLQCTLSSTGVIPGAYSKVTVNSKGQVTYGTNLSENDIAGIATPLSHVGTGGNSHAIAVSNGLPGFMSGEMAFKLNSITGTNTGDQVLPTTLPTPFSLNFAISGGSVPGTTFDGSTAKTIDYSTVGAAPALHTHSYQAADGDLLAISGLTGNSGVLRKTGIDTWILDTSAYTTNSGTVTSVALNLGSTGSDINSSVATSSTDAVISLNIPTASSVNRGLLSSADWTTFNNKQPAGTYATGTGTANGTNTGDQTTITGNAGSATTLSAGADRTKLDGIEANANNYTHPISHSPSIITQDTNNRFVTDAEKTLWTSKQPAGAYVTGTGTSSGTNTGDNAVNSLYSGLVSNATHTGDVTGDTVLTIGNNKVSLAKLAQMDTGNFVGRNTAGTGNVENLSVATVKTMLGLGSAAYTTSTSYEVPLTFSNGVSRTLNSINVTYGSTANTATQGNDVRLSDSRPASDVFAWAKAATKPTYTAGEVGLTNVDNTSDLNKPISTATQAALDLKPNDSDIGTRIGIYSVLLSNIATDDIISFNGSGWVNATRSVLTDGGNF